MSKLIDLTGQRFGSLTVLEKDTKKASKGTYWICKCDCGKTVSKASDGLRKGETTCCDRRACPNKKELFDDLRGKKFGRLTALEPTEKRKNKSVVWICQCDCGTIKEIPAYHLTSGGVKSCGCLKSETDKMPKNNTINEIGNVYGHLTVIARDGSDNNGQAKWLCRCDCENQTIISVLGGNLRKGHTQSCGCDRSSHGEKEVARLLLENNIPFETQKSFFNYENGHNAPFDFYVNKEYLIEYDGETHDINYAQKHGWLTEESITKQIQRDRIKDQWCKDNNIILIRIPYTHLKDLCIEDLLLETSTFIVNGENDEEKYSNR